MIGNPNKWIRKALFDALNNQVIDGETFLFFDQAVTDDTPDQYFLVGLQQNLQLQNKCSPGWENETEIQVVVRRKINQGSKLLLDNATEFVFNAMQNLTLDAGAGMTIHTREISTPTNFTTPEGGELFYYQVINLQTNLY